MLPTSALPKHVDKLILCDSPPLRVELPLSKVKYPNPKSVRHTSLSVISQITRFAMIESFFPNSNDCICSSTLSIGQTSISERVIPATST